MLFEHWPHVRKGARLSVMIASMAMSVPLRTDHLDLLQLQAHPDLKRSWFETGEGTPALAQAEIVSVEPYHRCDHDRSLDVPSGSRYGYAPTPPSSGSP
jgi:hypothetical protein